MRSNFIQIFRLILPLYQMLLHRNPKLRMHNIIHHITLYTFTYTTWSVLSGNQIASIHERAFENLIVLEELWVKNDFCYFSVINLLISDKKLYKFSTGISETIESRPSPRMCSNRWLVWSFCKLEVLPNWWVSGQAEAKHWQQRRHVGNRKCISKTSGSVVNGCHGSLGKRHL
jgi:hypothetical protein